MTAATGSGSDVRAMRREVASAGDSQVLQVLRLVDGLAARGAADALLAPVRPRLRVLRPARKLRFARLLFLPLDPLIVSPADWRPGTALVPRSALAPMAGLVAALLPDLAREIETLVGDSDTTDTALVCRAGALLWPRAAEVLATAAMPAEWLAESLPAAEFPLLANAVACNLAAEARMAELEQPVVPRDEIEATLADLLSAAERRGTRCWGMLLPIVMQRFPDAEAPMRAAAARTEGAGAQAGKAAIDLALTWVEECAEQRGAADLHHAGADVRRQIALLNRLVADPARRRHVLELRAALHASCAQRFEVGLRERIAMKLGVLPATGADAVLEAMEGDARDLRRLEAEARRLGGAASYDAQLHAVANTVMAQAGWGRFDRLRLVEILLGPKAAMQALACADP